MTDTLEETVEPLILKRKKKLAAEHHGGAWKVAYADFVTAMMAFFLLLWLLNVTTEEQKRGISDFFEPIGVSEEDTGLGATLKGLSVEGEGALRSAGSPPTVMIPVPASVPRPRRPNRGARPRKKRRRPSRICRKSRCTRRKKTS